jgi:CheY-like chemotaxis protein
VVKVLVVDDSLEVVSSIRLILQAENWCVDGAFDGEDGIRRALSSAYDLFIVDFKMPRVGGIEFVRRVQRHRTLGSVPIIFVSADPDPADRAQALDLGVRDIIPKPFDPRELIVRIRRVFERISLESQDDRVTKSLETGMSGKIGEISPVDLLQIYQLGRKDGTLVVRSGVEKARIFFRRGEACAAHVERDGFQTIRGVDAIYTVMRWTEGDFAMDFRAPETNPNVSMSIDQILIEGMRRADEAERCPDPFVRTDRR